MDVGLIILGTIILLGAGALLKSTRFMDMSDGSGVPPRVESQPVSSPSQLALQFESPATAGRGAFRVCRNCLSENSIDAEYCGNCGKKLTRPKDLKISEAQRKWFRQFNWIKNPFTPDIIPSLFTGYRDQVDEILKKLSMRSGNIMVLGDFGTGKTTMLRWLELNLPDSFHPIYIFRPPEKFSELIDVVAFGLDPSRGVKPGEYNIYNIDKLVQRVNKNVVILIDEAHEIDLSLNKSLKTLGDIENINLVLAGLPRLDEKIKKEGPALYERIVCKVELFNLSAEETRDLIVKRIENVGGWGHEPFTEDAVDEVYRLSDGNPRKIIKLCDCAVTSATSEGILTIDKNFLVESCEKKQSVVDEKTARLPSPTESTAPATAKVINVADGKPPELKSVIAERIRKLDKLYEEYLKTSDSGGMKEVLDIAQSTVEESRKRLKDESVSQKERERLTLVSDLFEEWIKKVGEKKVS